MIRPSPRQLEILQLLGRGYTSDQIARRLTLSPATVRRHTENVRKITDADNVTRCIVVCIARGYLRVDDIDEQLDVVPAPSKPEPVPDPVPLEQDGTGDGEDEVRDPELIYSSHPNTPGFAEVDVELRGPERLSLRH